MGTFYSTIKSRMMVTEVVNHIRCSAMWTFDYVTLLLVASILASIGLLEDSSVILVASMLVSPIMGPILAGVFGSAISDKRLRNGGITHEVVSLLICIAVGFILGLINCPFTQYGQYETERWPTSEMLSRGDFRGLYVGIAIAIPSGAGVAISVLGNNAASMVGVAISASLLPPAVNAGLFWASAIVYPHFTGNRLHKHRIPKNFFNEININRSCCN